MQCWQRQHLLHVDVGSSGYLLDPVRNLLRDKVISLQVSASDLDVERGRQPKVQDLRNDVSGLEKKVPPGETAGQLLAQCSNVSRGGLMTLLLQSHQDLRVAGSDHPGVAVRQVEP